jgi:Flp pilus assembly protein TadG
MRTNPNARRGATLVESAFVFPIVFLFVAGLVVGAMGIFRYQETAYLARETARYACVHGTQYSREAGVPAPTSQQLFATIVGAQMVSLDPTQLSATITWNSSNSPTHPTDTGGNIVAVTNTVRVTVTYQWIPESFLGGFTLTSTSEMPMAY